MVRRFVLACSVAVFAASAGYASSYSIDRSTDSSIISERSQSRRCVWPCKYQELGNACVCYTAKDLNDVSPEEAQRLLMLN
jgi:hypothetical protein